MTLAGAAEIASRLHPGTTIASNNIQVERPADNFLDWLTSGARRVFSPKPL